MFWSLSNGYEIWLTKLNKNKFYNILIKEPETNEFKNVGVIKDFKVFKNALSFYSSKERSNSNSNVSN